MEKEEIEKHLIFFKNEIKDIGNAFKVSLNRKIKKDKRNAASDLLNTKICNVRTYVINKNLKESITNELYSSDKSFELYDIQHFEKDVPKIIRWLEDLQKESHSNEEE